VSPLDPDPRAVTTATTAGFRLLIGVVRQFTLRSRGDRHTERDRHKFDKQLEKSFPVLIDRELSSLTRCEPKEELKVSSASLGYLFL